MLQIDNISKIYGEKSAVKDLQLEVGTGEVLGFLGPNGSGKTTTFRMILGIISPTKGSVNWDNENIKNIHKKMIGYLPEERGLFSNLKVDEHIKLFAKLKGMDNDEIEEAISYWAKRLEFEQYLRLKVGQLSKGNQQKIQLVIAIIHRPKLLILDEPFSGLDPINVELLKSVVKTLKAEGVTILFSSHRMEHVEELCEKICILKNGEPIISGYIDEIKRNFGGKRVIIEGKEDFTLLKTIDGIKDFQPYADGVYLTIKSSSILQDILGSLKNFEQITRFSLEDPSLNEIFIAKVGQNYE